ncbi:hypothetical protein [uncultured Amaricoccus sp.]|uniref:hypothetical protein n=1 Tax=uncultured Amaricoccus sp. TaxID=339341 RepID=UPI002610CC84|nr:hypothetical protein [uncultured Amaricoccus sp.]
MAMNDDGLRSLYDLARSTPSLNELAPQGAVGGACISVRPGRADFCGELTKSECAFVDKTLRDKGEGFASWFPGPCKS